MQTIIGKSVFTEEQLSVGIEDGYINTIEQYRGTQKGLPYISPGFFDTQVNGYNGSDYSLPDLSRQHILNIIHSLAKSGTTQHVPTFVSMPQDRLVHNLGVTVKSIRESEDIAAAIPGFHIEGPYISPEDGPRGAHDKKFVRRPSFTEFEEWQTAAEGMILYVTVAPEIDGMIDFIRRVVDTGVTVSIGHSGADPEDIQRAVDAGASFSTHLGNGSNTYLPRLKNYLWEQLSTDKLYAGLICDGFHIPKSVVRVIARAKGIEKIVLVSDVALIGGYPPGLYKWGDLDVQVFNDGHLGLPNTNMLAGAAHLLDWDIPRFIEFTGHTLGTAVSLCTVNPARLIGMSQPYYGELVEGAPANLCVFDYQEGADRFKILQTYVMGTLVFKS